MSFLHEAFIACLAIAFVVKYMTQAWQLSRDWQKSGITLRSVLAIPCSLQSRYNLQDEMLFFFFLSEVVLLPHEILIITSILFLLMVSSLGNVRGSTIIVTVVLITVLLLPLTASINTNVSLQSQSVFAQQQEGGEAETTDTTTMTNETTTEPTDFLPYNNPTYGIFIQYPSDWIASTNGLTDYTDLIAFYSPLQNLSDSFPARLTISVITYSQNVSLPEYTNFVLTRLNQSVQPVDVRSSSEVTVAGYPGHRLVLAIQPIQNSTLVFHQMNTWTTIGNNVYLLTYEGEESRFNQHLPEVSRMLESLIITGNDNVTNAAVE